MGKVSINQSLSLQVVHDYVNKWQYATFKARLASKRHLWINVDLSNPIDPFFFFFSWSTHDGLVVGSFRSRQHLMLISGWVPTCFVYCVILGLRLVLRCWASGARWLVHTKMDVIRRAALRIASALPKMAKNLRNAEMLHSWKIIKKI